MFKKGEVIETLDPRFIVDLDWDGHEFDLPRLEPERRARDCPSESYRKFLERPNIDHQLAFAVVFCLYVKDKQIDLPGVDEDAVPEDCDHASLRLIQETRPQELKPEEWSAMVWTAYRNVFPVSREHVLHKYAEHVVPDLSVRERELVYDVVGLPRRSSNLALTKDLKDHFESIVVLVWFDQPYEHSCLPTAQLEFDGDSLRLVALFDGTAVRVNRVGQGMNLEDRVRTIERFCGSSCQCSLCRWELDQKLSAPELLELGKHFLVQGDTSKAQQCLKQCTVMVPSDAESWHALGAVYLADGKFLEAQRLWNDVSSSHDSCRRHEGIHLELAKQEAYGHLVGLRHSSETVTTHEITFSPILDNVFVAKKILGEQTCRDIIGWAHECDWTTQRHYAVPTKDVPVHASSPLLSWFNDWMAELGCVLASMFHTTTNFYVHDAFCVHYEGGARSSRLPIHTDESTHSFVLALSDGFTGGGTYFRGVDRVVTLQVGDLLAFRGDLVEHGGEIVKTGSRYILAGFLFHDDDGVARRGEKRSHCFTETSRREMDSKSAFSFGFMS